MYKYRYNLNYLLHFLLRLIWQHLIFNTHLLCNLLPIVVFRKWRHNLVGSLCVWLPCINQLHLAIKYKKANVPRALFRSYYINYICQARSDCGVLNVVKQVEFDLQVLSCLSAYILWWINIGYMCYIYDICNCVWYVLV